MKRKTKIISELLFLGILFSILGLVYWLLYTTTGLNWSLQQVNRATGSVLDYGKVEGAWLKGMRFEYFHIHVPQLEIRSNNLGLDINIRNLLSGTLEVESLQADELGIAVTPSPTSATSSSASRSQTLDFALPLAIDIFKANIHQFQYRQSNQAPVVVYDIDLTDTRIKKQFNIGSVTARTSFGEISVNGSFFLQTEGEMDLNALFTIYPIESVPQIQGSISVTGTLNDMHLSSQLSQPFSTAISAKLESIMAEPSWQAQISAQNAPLKEHFPQIPLTLRNVTINGKGDFSQYTVNAAATATHQQLGEWAIQLSGNKTATQWNVDSLTLANDQTESAITAHATIQGGYVIDTNSEISLKLDWRNLQWPFDGTALATSESGEINAQGSIDNYQLTTTGGVNWAGKNISNIVINASGTPESLTVDELKGDLLDGSIAAKGILQFKEQLTWQSEVTASAIDLHALYTELDTRLTTRVSINGKLTETGYDSAFNITKLSGKINGRSVRGKANVFLNSNSLKLSNIVLQSGKNRVQSKLVRYQFGNDVQPSNIKADWDLNISDLKLLNTKLHGSVISHGAIQGSMQELAGNLNFQATDFLFEQYRVKQATLDAALDFSDRSESRIVLSMQQGNIGEIPIKSAQLDATGRLAQHAINITLEQNSDNNLQVRADGSWVNDQWNLTLQSTQVNTAQFGQWQQTNSTAVQVTSKQLSVTKYCLASDHQGEICTTAQSPDYQTWDAQANVAQIPLGLFKDLLPPQFTSFDVDISGHTDMRYTQQEGIVLDINGNGDNGIIHGIRVKGKETPVAFDHIDFRFSNIHRKLEAAMSVSIRDSGTIDMAFAFPNWSRLALPEPDESIQGQVEIDLTNLALLTVLSDHIKDPVGTLHSNIEIKGTLAAPILLGKSRVQATNLTLTKLNVELHDVELTATADERRVLTIDGHAKSGEGTVKINGSLDDYRSDKPTGTVNITGNNFLAARIPEATVLVSPKLQLTLQGNNIDMQGDLHIPKADIKIFTPTKTITPSPDVVIVTQQTSKETKPTIALTARIRVVLGDDVKIQGYGLSSSLGGSVLIEDTGTLTTASGEINIVKGKYAAYGAELDIVRGSLSFTGRSIDNPLVDARAQREVNNVVAGVLIEGDVKEPKIKLFSEPAMDDSNVLSYIILGQPLNAASDQDGKLLTSAAASLGLLGGEKLAKELGDRFGIDEVKIQTDKNTQDTSVLLGKYLSPDFYVGYAVGIGDAVDTLQIQYKFTEQWVLKTESGEQQSAEILFTIEKD